MIAVAALTIIPNIDKNPQFDLADAKIIRILDAMDSHVQIRVCGIPNGTEGRATVVAIMSPLPDGGWVMSEIKLAQLKFALEAIEIACGP